LPRQTIDLPVKSVCTCVNGAQMGTVGNERAVAANEENGRWRRLWQRPASLTAPEIFCIPTTELPSMHESG